MSDHSDPGFWKALMEKYAQSGSLGLGDKLGAAGQGAYAAATGGDFADTYGQALRENKDVLARSGKHQPVASAVGNLLGAIPSFAGIAPRLGITATAGALSAAQNFNENDQATMAERLKRALAAGGMGAAVGKLGQVAPLATGLGTAAASQFVNDPEQRATMALGGLGMAAASQAPRFASLMERFFPGKAEPAASVSPELQARLEAADRVKQIPAEADAMIAELPPQTNWRQVARAQDPKPPRPGASPLDNYSWDLAGKPREVEIVGGAPRPPPKKWPTLPSDVNLSNTVKRK